MKELPRMRSARTVTLLEVVVCEGTGVTPIPLREVTYYYSPDGELVARRDPWAEPS